MESHIDSADASRQDLHAANVTRQGVPFVDVLDRVLDKGIIIAYDINISVIGIRAIEITGHVTVASIETHLRLSRALGDGQQSEALSSAIDAFLRGVDFPREPPAR